MVVRDVNVTPDILPTGSTAMPIFSAKASVKLDLSDYFAFIGAIYYTRDANRTTFRDSLLGVAEPSFQKEDELGFNLVLNARF